MTLPTLTARSRRTLLAVVLLPTILALIVCALTIGKAGTNGDEPHYLIMADSLVTDASFDLRPAYARDAQTAAIFGPVPPHMVFVQHRWMPFHTPGMSILIALPFWLQGQAAVRIWLCLLMALLPWSIVRWTRARLTPADAAWLTLGVVVCSPACFGGSRIFPDLPAGVFATALALWLLNREEDDARPLAWAGAGLAMGLLTWLNVKFVATSGVFLAGLLGVAWHASRTARPATARMALMSAGCLVVGPLGLVAFNVWAYDNLTGGRFIAEVASVPSRAAEIFLGLHLDQSQGMFVRNPLLLAGVLFLPLFFRRQPAQAAFWGLLYLSLIGPNSLELARYGGGAPTSRFAWPAMWLWAVPMVTGLAAYPRLRRYLPAATVVALVYQAALAVRWLRTPDVLFPYLSEKIAERDSLFPLGIRGLLPSFYFWDFSSYWTYVPNLAAMLTVALILVAGIALARSWPVRATGRDSTGAA
ncbi:MAG TPA: hypothetical protein VGK32_19970 [Vicinamibacterales bacterium]|jgi:hypothetical protein